MKIQDVMTADVRCCRPDDNLADVVRNMWEADCGAMPVISQDGRVIGMITDRDICVAIGTKGRTADRIAVREVAHDHIHTCRPQDDTTAALKTMQMEKVRRLPVIDDDGRLRGMLSLNDIVTHTGAATTTQVMNALTSICEHRLPSARMTAS